MTEKRFNLVGSYLYDGEECVSHFNDPSHREEIIDLLNQLNDENTMLKEEIKDFQELLASKEEVYLKPIIRQIEEAYETERTHIGRNVLKQLLNNIGETNE